MKKLLPLLLSILLLASTAWARPSRFVTKMYGASNPVIWTVEAATPPNIVTHYDDWVDWAEYRQAQFYKQHPLNRANTYYFSSSEGSDSADCNSLEPCETKSKCTTLIAANGGNTRCRFKADDIWEELTTLTVSHPRVTIDCYQRVDESIQDCTPASSKPRFSAWRGRINSGAAWSVFSGNTYSITNTTDGIGWVRNADDRLGDSLGSWTLATSNAFSDTNISFPAWFKDDATDTLYVNLGSATSPSTINIEYSENNRNSGVSIANAADATRVDNLRFDGLSLDRTSPNHNQGYGVIFLGTGDKSALVTNTESYYASSHNYGSLNSGNTGGHSMWIGNKAGYPMHNGSSSETIFNSYALGAHETWFVENNAKYGATRLGNWQPAVVKVDSEAFFAHTAGGTSGLHVVWKNQLEDSVNPVADIGRLGNCTVITSPSEMPLSRCFMVANTQIHGVKTGGANYNWQSAAYNILMNNRLAITPRATGGLAINTFLATQNFYIQNHFKLDYSQWGTGARGFYNTTSSDNLPHFWHNVFELDNTSGTGGNIFGLDYDTRGGAGDTSPNATAYNNILSNNHNSTFAGFYFGLNNDPALMAGNAVFKITDTAVGNPSGYGDTDHIVLNTSPVFSAPPAVIKNTGSSSIPFALSHDINGVKRNGIDIGAVVVTDSTAFTPSALGGLRLWLDASDATTITTATGVSAWNDKSGNSFNTTQGTGARQPILDSASLNAKNTISFNGSQSLDFATTASAIVGSTTQPATMFSILKTVSDPAIATTTAGFLFSRDILSGVSWGSTNNDHYPWLDGLLYMAFGTSVRKATTNPVPSLTNWHKLEIQTAPANYTIFLNESQFYNTTTNTVGWVASNVTLGGGASASHNFAGSVAEAIIYNRLLSATEKAKVYQYLNEKWGL